MPFTIPSPIRQIPIEPLAHSSFAPFGAVIENPTLATSEHRIDLRHVTANQGTAQRWFDISHLTDFYSISPSRRPGKPSISLARCAPRKLRKLDSSSIHHTPKFDADPAVGASFNYTDKMAYDINILERHPYTSQTFIPIGLSPDDPTARYLVIVAPTLPVSKTRKELRDRPKPYPTPDSRPKRSLLDVFSRARPSPFTNEKSPPTPDVLGQPVEKPKGAGMPDLSNIRVFLAKGSQAVTYAAGTWHAPMAVIGQKPIDFVIVQNMNGVGIEDCQEVELTKNDGEGLTVMLDMTSFVGQPVQARL